jgi:hypothetical protein
MDDMDASLNIPTGAAIKTWDSKLFALAEELAADLRRTRELYEKARDPLDPEE